MDIRSSLDGLRTILGVGQTPPSTPQTKTGTQTSSSGIGSDRATFSFAASGVAQSGPDSDVRLDKVASIQQQLAAGTYNVPASAVAGALVNALLSGER